MSAIKSAKMRLRVLAEKGSDSLPSRDARRSFSRRMLCPPGNVIHVDAVFDGFSMHGDNEFFSTTFPCARRASWANIRSQSDRQQLTGGYYALREFCYTPIGLGRTVFCVATCSG